eukprot:tig00000403_g358.t1
MAKAPEPVSAVNADANWRQRIRSELDAAKTFEGTYGFLIKEPHKMPQIPPEPPAPHTKGRRQRVSTPELMTRLRRLSTLSRQDINPLFPKEMNDKSPTEKYGSPLLTSHEYGWSYGKSKAASLDTTMCSPSQFAVKSATSPKK